LTLLLPNTGYSKSEAKRRRRISDLSRAGAAPAQVSRGGAEKKDVRPRTRLDPVVKLREQNEELRRRELADAGRKLKTAEEQLEESRARAHSDQRRTASASDWQLAELAHGRALMEVRTAEQAVQSAAEESSASRERYATARSKAEAVRRVAALRVEEILAGREAVERRELDEVGTMRAASARIQGSSDEAASGT
jgi:flagellar export protein FliJ